MPGVPLLQDAPSRPPFRVRFALPLPLKWCEQLLADRSERVAQERTRRPGALRPICGVDRSPLISVLRRGGRGRLTCAAT